MMNDNPSPYCNPNLLETVTLGLLSGKVVIPLGEGGLMAQAALNSQVPIELKYSIEEIDWTLVNILSSMPTSELNAQLKPATNK